MTGNSPEPNKERIGHYQVIIVILLGALLWQCKPGGKGEYQPEDYYESGTYRD